jgi:drug/metabolite transporter (DMT)-like permease
MASVEFHPPVLAEIQRQPSLGDARLAAGVLAFCCVCWGMSFPVMQFAATAMHRSIQPVGEMPLRLNLASQAVFNGWRFGLAALAFGLITFRSQRGHSEADWKGGLSAGLFCGAGMFLQLVGLRYTLASVSAFLTALVVVFAPLGQSLLFRKPVGLRTWLAVAVAVAGSFILAQPHDGAGDHSLTLTSPLPYLGEILTVIGSLFFTAQILAVGHYGQRAEPARLTLIALAANALVNLACGFALGGGQIHTAHILRQLLRDPVFMASLLALAAFGSVVAMHLMNIYQPLVSAATASVIYCLEPVFATLWSLGFGAERFAAITAIGGGIILLAVLIEAAGLRRART